jgi:DivIVA domain-containing protein
MTDLIPSSSHMTAGQTASDSGDFGRPTTGGDFSADAIRAQKFDTSFRGFDTTQVRQFLQRVGAQVSTLNEQVAGLSLELESARSVRTLIDLTESRPPVSGSLISPAVPSVVDAPAVLPREATDLLDEARKEAKLIVDRANDEAGRILLRARAESRGKQHDGSRVVVTGASSGAGSVSVSAAEVTVADAVSAHLDGPELDNPEAAREHAKAMIAEARAVRERILTDLAKRRRTAHVQLEQLRVGREKLQETMREARRVIDAATTDLVHAETEARLAAESAGRRVAAEPMPTAEQIDAEVSGGRHMSYSPSPIDHSVDPPIEHLVDTRTDDMSTEDIGADDLIVGDPTTVDSVMVIVAEQPVEVVDVVEVIDVVEVEVVELTFVEIEDEPTIELVMANELAASSELIDVVEPIVPMAGPELVTVVEPPLRATDAFAKLRAQKSSVRDVPAETVAASGAETTPVGAETVSEKKPKKAKRPAAKLTGLIAEATNEHVATAEPLEPPVHAPVSALEIESNSESNIAVALFERRSAELELLQLRVSRRLKRQLQDDHSAALSSVRRTRGHATVDSLLGDSGVALRRLADVVEPGFAEALDAGRRTTASLLGLSGQAESVVQRESLSGLNSESIALALATRMLDDISISIEAGLADPTAEASSVLGSAFREWTTERIGREVADSLAAAYGVGSQSQIAAQTLVRWVVEHGDEPSPDCDDNSLAGPVIIGEHFPTGHAVPPLGNGCRCVVVPN